jgi:hypothetical protein|nr:MAG TPA: hypothetical protein [Caudoviricetes sp.]
MVTIADLKQHLEQFDDDAMIVFRADTERELYDDSALIDMRERLTYDAPDEVNVWGTQEALF